MPELQLWTYVIVSLSFALYLGIAIWTLAGSTNEFYVANANISPVANGMAIAADWMSAASFISMAGTLAFGGYSASAYLMGWTGGYVLIAVLLAPYLRKFGKFTVPAFIGDRYDSTFARLIAIGCLIMISLTYVIGQMKGVGLAFARFMDIAPSTGIYLGMAIIFFYAVLGGMKGITYTQIAQYVVLVLAYTIPIIFISLQLTGNSFPQLGLGSSLVDDHSTYLLDKLDSLLVGLGFNAYTATPDNPTNMFMLTLTLMLGTAGLPHIIMRFFTVSSVRDTRFSAAWALVCIAILYTSAPAVGAMARFNLLQTFQIGEVGTQSGNLEYRHRPQWVRNWEKTGLLQFKDLNNDGRIQYYQDQNKAESARFESYGWRGNELVSVDNDIMVLANPEIAKLPDWVVALVAAGAIAAALSTAAGLLLAIAAAISRDLLKDTFAKAMSDRTELRISRIVMGLAILIAGIMGLHPPGFAAQVVALAFGLAASSLFPALVLGIFSKRINKFGAIAGMLAGFGVTTVYIALYKGWFFVTTPMFPNTPEYWLWGISPEAFGAVGAGINALVAIVISALSKPPSAEIQALVDYIRIPNTTK